MTDRRLSWPAVGSPKRGGNAGKEKVLSVPWLGTLVEWERSVRWGLSEALKCTGNRPVNSKRQKQQESSAL